MKKPVKTKRAETPEQKIERLRLELPEGYGIYCLADCITFGDSGEGTSDPITAQPSEPFDMATALADFKAANPDLPAYEYPWATELQRHEGRLEAGLNFLIKTALADDENYDAIEARKCLARLARFMFDNVKLKGLSDTMKRVAQHGEKDKKERTIFEQELAKRTHGKGPKHKRDDFAWVVIELQFVLSMMHCFVNQAWEMEWKEKVSNKVIMQVISGILGTMEGEAHYKAALTKLVNAVFPDSAWGGNANPPPGCAFRWHLVSSKAQEGRGFVFDTLLDYLKAEWPNHAKKKADGDNLKAMLKSALRSWPETPLHGVGEMSEEQRLEITRLHSQRKS